MQLDKFLITSQKFYDNIDANILYAHTCGVSKIYLREFEESRFYKCLEVCKGFGILLFVHYIDKYKQCILESPCGIHLKGGELSTLSLIPSKKITSYSAHSLNDVREAYTRGVDCIFLSPVFFVENKPVPLGIEYFYHIPDEYKDRIYALGGIDSSNIDMFYDTKIRGIAGIRMFLKD